MIKPLALYDKIRESVQYEQDYHRTKTHPSLIQIHTLYHTPIESELKKEVSDIKNIRYLILYKTIALLFPQDERLTKASKSTFYLEFVQISYFSQLRK